MYLFYKQKNVDNPLKYLLFIIRCLVGIAYYTILQIKYQNIKIQSIQRFFF